MSIFYDEKQKLFQLDTKTTSYVIGIADGYAGHVYYGKKLESLEGLGALLRTGEAPLCRLKICVRNVPLQIHFRQNIQHGASAITAKAA